MVSLLLFTVLCLPFLVESCSKIKGNVVDVVYIGSSRCPLCTVFLRKQVAKVYPQFYESKRLNVTYLPYTECEDVTTNSIYCASDIATLQACYMNNMTGPSLFTGLLDIQTSGSIDQALTKCTGMDQKQLKSCATGMEGRRLLGKYRNAALKIVYSLGISSWRYPLLVVNGKRNMDTEALKRNMATVLCDKFFKPKAKEC